MSAQLATVGGRILAQVEDAGVIRDGRMEVSFDNVYVLVYEGTITSRKDLLPLLEQITKSGRPMLIVAGDIIGEALATLVVKKLSGYLQVAAVKAPGLGDQRKGVLHDIALFTGGKTTTKDIGIQLSDMHISDLGQAGRTIVDNGHTCITTLESRDPLKRIPMSLLAAACVLPEFDS